MKSVYVVCVCGIYSVGSVCGACVCSVCVCTGCGVFSVRSEYLSIHSCHSPQSGCVGGLRSLFSLLVEHQISKITFSAHTRLDLHNAIDFCLFNCVNVLDG